MAEVLKATETGARREAADILFGGGAYPKSKIECRPPGCRSNRNDRRRETIDTTQRPPAGSVARRTWRDVGFIWGLERVWAKQGRRGKPGRGCRMVTMMRRRATARPSCRRDGRGRLKARFSATPERYAPLSRDRILITRADARGPFNGGFSCATGNVGFRTL